MQADDTYEAFQRVRHIKRGNLSIFLMLPLLRRSDAPLPRFLYVTVYIAKRIRPPWGWSSKGTWPDREVVQGRHAVSEKGVEGGAVHGTHADERESIR